MWKWALCLLTILFYQTAHAEDLKLYEAKVTIDAVAEDSAKARDKAMTQANRKALYAITERISPQESLHILDELNDNQILNFIQEVSVLSEKVIDNKYQAELLMTVNAPILKAYLSEKNIPVTIMPKNHIIIIPVYQKGSAGTPQLWEEDNPWYKTWADNTIDGGQNTITPISKSPENQALLGAEDAIQLNGLSLDALQKNNPDSKFFVAEAVDNENTLQITLKSPQSGTILTKAYEGDKNVFLTAAFQDIKEAVIKESQQQVVLQDNALNRITLVFNYQQLKDWLDLQKAVRSINRIEKSVIDAYANRRAQMTIDYTGSLEELQHQFAGYGFSLSDAGSFYNVERMN